MTSGRFTLLGAAAITFAVVLAAPGCGDAAAPCTECPALEGRYDMEFGDAGVPGDCTLLGVTLPRGRPLDINRSGDRLIGNLEGVGLLGTISPQGSFSMSGTSVGGQDGGRTDTINLAGRFSTPLGDGGAGRLDGTYTGNFSRSSGTTPQRCSVIVPFSATRD